MKKTRTVFDEARTLSQLLGKLESRIKRLEAQLTEARAARDDAMQNASTEALRMVEMERGTEKA